jgi:hypothetical protein
MPQIENNENLTKKYINREDYEWTREQGSKRNKEYFVNATVIIAAFAVYATWFYMIGKKLTA